MIDLTTFMTAMFFAVAFGILLGILLMFCVTMGILTSISSNETNASHINVMPNQRQRISPRRTRRTARLDRR
jgi:ABC-type methionine transport system permease subunit